MNKCVILIDENLPLGLIANTAAVLGSSFGKMFPDNIGDDNFDKDNNIHKGIVNVPISILKSNKTSLSEMKSKLSLTDQNSIHIVDFCDVAQTCNDYEDYTKKLSTSVANDIEYLGILIYGDKKTVTSLTGSFPLLR